MNKIVSIIIVSILLVGIHKVSGQGCSDAGFCTMGAMKPDQNFSRKVNFKLKSIGLSYYRGKTTNTPIVRSLTADLNFGITDKLSVQLKIPYQKVTQGGLIAGNRLDNPLSDTDSNGKPNNPKGIGDISLAVTRNIKRTEKFDLNATLGVKIPTRESNDKAENGLTLPGYYQISLGTYDIVAGLSFLTEKWLFAVGYQQALTSNKNDFTWGEWVEFPDREYLNSYDVGIGLRRGIDIMLRAERNWRFLNYSFNVGVLPIYRITPDQGIIFAREDGARVKVTGLALSTLAGFTYHLNVNSSVKAIYGLKLTDRLTNPDGLTRDNVFTVAYQLKF